MEGWGIIWHVLAFQLLFLLQILKCSRPNAQEIAGLAFMIKLICSAVLVLGIYEVFCNHKNFYIGKQPEPFPGTNTVIAL